MRRIEEEEEALRSIKDWRERWNKYFEHYQIEIVLIAVFIIGLANYVVGR